MPSDIYRTIVKRKIDTFIGSFIEDANSIFKFDFKLIHPGEYGTFREDALKELLRILLDKDQGISDGFIITSNNKVSTQCDLIIYNAEASPLISEGIARFFPVEEVNGVIEVKSSLSKYQFKQALIKMARNKMLSRNNIGLVKKRVTNCGEMDDIVSYLICSKLNFNISDIDLRNIYGSIPQRYWHNGILSIEDGYISYRMHYADLPDNMAETREKLIRNNDNSLEEIEYSVHIEGDNIYEAKPYFLISKSENIYRHIMDFIVSIDKALKLKTTFYSDFITYLGFDSESINKLI